MSGELNYLRKRHLHLCDLAPVGLPVTTRNFLEAIILPEARHDSVSLRRHETGANAAERPHLPNPPKALAEQRSVKQAPYDPAAHQKTVNFDRIALPFEDDQPRVPARPETVLRLQHEHPHIGTVHEVRQVRFGIAL